MPCLVNQIMHRIAGIRIVKDEGSGLNDEINEMLKPEKSLLDNDFQAYLLNLKQPKRRLEDNKEKKLAAVSSCIFDIISGIIFALIAHYYISFDDLAILFTKWRDSTHGFLNELLDWLVGAPAGLKLNHELTIFLGKFFLYHVYIWIGYLLIMEPYYVLIIKIILYSSCFGLSTMLSLASDALSFLTFHTYCFYVYAAKIYKLQLQGLISLARLLRGKKWNPLRNRVDSIPFDANQLAFGTILFTIFLFLLPTTGIYYLVFTLLRLPILVLKAVIYYVTGILNSIPIYAVVQRVLSSSQPVDGVSMRLLYGKQESYNKTESRVNKDCSTAKLCLADGVVVRMLFTKESIQAILKRKTNFGLKNFFSLPTLLKSLIFGDVVNSLYSLKEE
eukprot:gene4626-20901_t